VFSGLYHLQILALKEIASVKVLLKTANVKDCNLPIPVKSLNEYELLKKRLEEEPGLRQMIVRIRF
jgi:hypothetical protein